MLDAENAMHQQEAVGNHHAREGLCARRCQDTRLKSPSLKAYLIRDKTQSILNLSHMYGRRVCNTLQALP